MSVMSIMAVMFDTYDRGGSMLGFYGLSSFFRDCKLLWMISTQGFKLQDAMIMLAAYDHV
jgi:hypothetical protein